MKKHGALFDLDGVLIDSETAYTGFWQQIDRDYPTGIENYAIAIKGTTLEEIMKHYDDESVKADILKRIHEFQGRMQFEIFDGVMDFLEDLREHGIPCAIVTSSDDRKMERLFKQLPQLKEMFDVVIDASMVVRSKPDPEGYLKAAAALGCDPRDCFVFEDSRQGVKAGRASGAKVVGLATTLPAEAISADANIVIPSFKSFSVEQLFRM